MSLVLPRERFARLSASLRVGGGVDAYASAFGPRLHHVRGNHDAYHGETFADARCARVEKGTKGRPPADLHVTIPPIATDGSITVTKRDPAVRGSSHIRHIVGDRMVLGLEFFIASDVIQTVVVPTWESLGMLAGIVAIRTVIVYFLEYEMRSASVPG